MYSDVNNIRRDEYKSRFSDDGYRNRPSSSSYINNNNKFIRDGDRYHDRGGDRYRDTRYNNDNRDNRDNRDNYQSIRMKRDVYTNDNNGSGGGFRTVPKVNANSRFKNSIDFNRNDRSGYNHHHHHNNNNNGYDRFNNNNNIGHHHHNNNNFRGTKVLKGSYIDNRGGVRNYTPQKLDQQLTWSHDKFKVFKPNDKQQQQEGEEEENQHDVNDNNRNQRNNRYKERNHFNNQKEEEDNNNNNNNRMEEDDYDNNEESYTISMKVHHFEEEQSGDEEDDEYRSRHKNRGSPSYNSIDDGEKEEGEC